MADTQVTIERLGRSGEGLVRQGEVWLGVPYALPEETVLIAGECEKATLISVQTPSPHRRTPECAYFTRCGGCGTQHMDEALYAEWKRGLVLHALHKQGIETDVAPLIDAHGTGRRRVTFHGRFRDGKAVVGYMAPRSHDLVAIDHCPILVPELARAPKVAQRLAQRLSHRHKPLDLQITATETGLDCDIRGLGSCSPAERFGLIALANDLDLARLSLHGDVIVTRRAPVVTMGGAQVVLSPGGFLQATRQGEAVLSDLVRQTCEKAKKVLDLFAGCGPFSLRCAERSTVHAIDSEQGALDALIKAARSTPGLRQVSIEQRDLFRRPLLGPELKPYDAVILDPPRAGAQAQVQQLTASKVPIICYLSCDPTTFARDARLLLDSGYHLTRVTPIDQFRYSAHVELAACFTKGRS